MLATLAKDGGIEQGDIVGVLSSHPYTICAILRVFGAGIESLQAKSHALLEKSKCQYVLDSSPVEYVRKAKMRNDRLSADTGFYVDHGGLDEVVEMIAEREGVGEWVFGELEEGCEFACVLEWS